MAGKLTSRQIYDLMIDDLDANRDVLQNRLKETEQRLLDVAYEDLVNHRDNYTKQHEDALGTKLPIEADCNIRYPWLDKILSDWRLTLFRFLLLIFDSLWQASNWFPVVSGWFGFFVALLVLLECGLGIATYSYKVFLLGQKSKWHPIRLIACIFSLVVFVIDRRTNNNLLLFEIFNYLMDRRLPIEIRTLVKTIMVAGPIIIVNINFILFLDIPFALAANTLFSGAFAQRCVVEGSMLSGEPEPMHPPRFCKPNLDNATWVDSCPPGFQCWGMQSPNGGLRNFDNFPSSLLHVFIIATQSSWSQTYGDGLTDSTYSVIPRIWLLMLYTCVTYIAFTINLAIVLGEYNRIKEELASEIRALALQAERKAQRRRERALARIQAANPGFETTVDDTSHSQTGSATPPLASQLMPCTQPSTASRGSTRSSSAWELEIIEDDIDVTVSGPFKTEPPSKPTTYYGNRDPSKPHAYAVGWAARRRHITSEYEIFRSWTAIKAFFHRKHLFLYPYLDHTAYHLTVGLIIFSVILVNCLAYQGMPHSYALVISVLENFLLVVQTFEIILKIIAYGSLKEYCGFEGNIADVLFLLLAYVGLMIAEPGDYDNWNFLFMRGMTLGAMLGSIKTKRLEFFRKTIGALRPFGSQLILFFVIMFGFAAFSVAWFRPFYEWDGSLSQEDFDYLNEQRNNFNGLGNAMVTLFTMSTGDGWHEILLVTMRHYTVSGPIFCLSWYALCQFALTNFFVSVVVDQFRVPKVESTILEKKAFFNHLAHTRTRNLWAIVRWYVWHFSAVRVAQKRCFGKASHLLTVLTEDALLPHYYSAELNAGIAYWCVPKAILQKLEPEDVFKAGVKSMNDGKVAKAVYYFSFLPPFPDPSDSIIPRGPLRSAFHWAVVYARTQDMRSQKVMSLFMEQEEDRKYSQLRKFTTYRQAKLMKNLKVDANHVNLGIEDLDAVVNIYNPPERSFWILPRTSPFRQFCMNLIQKRGYQVFMFLASSVATMTIFFDPVPEADKTLPRSSTEDIQDLFNYLLLAVFSMDAGLVTVAKGFMPNRDHTAFLDSPWHSLDLFLWICNVLCIAFNGTKYVVISRCVRPLYIAQYLKGIQIYISAIFLSLLSISNAIFIITFLWLMFALLGMHYFMGLMRYCTDSYPYVNPNATSIIMGKDDCVGSFINKQNVLGPRSWALLPRNYDSISEALLSTLTMATLSGWQDIMYQTVDTTGIIDRQLVRDARPYMVMYSIACVVICGWFSSSLFISTIVLSVNKKRSTVYLSTEQNQWLAMQQYIEVASGKMIGKVTPDSDGSKSARAHVMSIVNHTAFVYFVLSVITIQMILLAVQHYGQPEGLDTVLELSSMFLIGVLASEVAMKIVGFGIYPFLMSGWNIYDLIVTTLVVAAYLMTFAVDNQHISRKTVQQLGQSFQTMTMIKIIKQIDHFGRMIDTVILSMPMMVDVSLLIAIFSFMYMSVGRALFGAIRYRTYINRNANFRSWVDTYYLILQSRTLDHWDGLMRDTIDLEPLCTNTPTFNDCGLYHAALAYYISLVLVGAYVLMNLMIPNILSNFVGVYLRGSNAIGIRIEDLNTFCSHWEKFDTTGEGYINRWQLKELLAKLKAQDNVFGTLTRNREVLWHLIHQLNYQGAITGTFRAKIITKDEKPTIKARLYLLLGIEDPDKNTTQARIALLPCLMHLARTLIPPSAMRLEELMAFRQIKLKSSYRVKGQFVSAIFFGHMERRKLIREWLPSSYATSVRIAANFAKWKEEIFQMSGKVRIKEDAADRETKRKRASQRQAMRLFNLLKEKYGYGVKADDESSSSSSDGELLLTGRPGVMKVDFDMELPSTSKPWTKLNLSNIRTHVPLLSPMLPRIPDAPRPSQIIASDNKYDLSYQPWKEPTPKINLPTIFQEEPTTLTSVLKWMGSEPSSKDTSAPSQIPERAVNSLAKASGQKYVIPEEPEPMPLSPKTPTIKARPFIKAPAKPTKAKPYTKSQTKGFGGNMLLPSNKKKSAPPRQEPIPQVEKERDQGPEDGKLELWAFEAKKRPMDDESAEPRRRWSV